MTDLPAPRLAATFEEVEDALLSRWPETRLEPSLDRIEAFTELLGDPQRAYPVIHLTGTNGKTSTSRMIDTLLRAHDLRTGRFTSPHVERLTERISVDGEPLSDDDFVRAVNAVAPYTNVVDAAVAVVLPIAVDHARYLGDTPVDISIEKAGIIKPGSTAVLAQQEPAVAAVLQARAEEVGATVVREGLDFGVAARVPAVGGQVVSLQGLRGRYDEVFLPLYGAHQAQNAAVALAAVEAFLGEGQPLDDEVVRAAFAEVTSPGRLEVVRRSPTIVLDAAHNPHGAEAVGAALEDSFTFDPLIGVIGVMGDKDADGLLAAFEPHLAHVVCTQNSTDRALSADRLAETAREIFGEDRVTVVPRLADAIEAAATLAEAGEAFGDPLGSGAVLV